MKAVGPFHGEGTVFKRRSGRYFGTLLTGETGAAVLRILRQCGVLSRHQIRELTGVTDGALKRSVSALVRMGFLDEYASGKTPPVYALGEGGARLIGVEHRVYATSTILRLVAANQLWVHLSRQWPDATWEIGDLHPFCVREGVRYAVAAPRLVPGDDVWALAVASMLGEGDRLLVVAATRDLALRVAKVVVCPARYTWDAVLKDGAIFYRYVQGDMVPEKIFVAGVDSGADVCYAESARASTG